MIELRRYALRHGMRDGLIALFERKFIESQEACGMLPLGHFCDLDDPDSFVWLRAFENMETRRAALEAFYVRSEAWQNHRDEANATMIDSDNVLLLRSARTGSGFDLGGLVRPPAGAHETESFAAVTIFLLDEPASESFIADFESRLLPQLQRRSRRIAYFVTEDRPNDFPSLPIREGDWALVVAGLCPDRTALDEWLRTFRDELCETLRLHAAPRSLLH